MTVREWRDTLLRAESEAARVEDEDIRLLQAARDDLAQFAPLYERYFTRIYRYCLRRVNQVEEAEDLTSLVFTRALAGLHSYRGGSAAAWLFQIAHHAVANHLRGRRAQVSLDDARLELASEHPPPLEQVIQFESEEALRELVAGLPDDQQNLLALKMAAGLDSKEIAAIVGKSPGAVRIELHRIIKRLRTLYEARQGKA